MAGHFWAAEADQPPVIVIGCLSCNWRPSHETAWEELAAHDCDEYMKAVALP